MTRRKIQVKNITGRTLINHLIMTQAYLFHIFSRLAGWELDGLAFSFCFLLSTRTLNLYTLHLVLCRAHARSARTHGMVSLLASQQCGALPVAVVSSRLCRTTKQQSLLAHHKRSPAKIDSRHLFHSRKCAAAAAADDDAAAATTLSEEGELVLGMG